MTRHDYICEDCEYIEYDVIYESMKDYKSNIECPKCKGTMRKLLYPIDFITQGAGFYSTGSLAKTKPNTDPNYRSNRARKQERDATPEYEGRVSLGEYEKN